MLGVGLNKNGHLRHGAQSGIFQKETRWTETINRTNARRILMANLYANDGVDINVENAFSSFAGEICKSTFRNSPFVDVHDNSEGFFRGARSFSFKNLPEGYTIDVGADGIGTKTVVIDAAFSHHLAARDIIAMTGGDITRRGGMPLVFINTLKVNSLEGSMNDICRSMLTCLGAIAREQKLVCFRGETAQLGECVGSEYPRSPTRFNWTGMMIGVCHPQKDITGTTLAPGQAVVALREFGFRSNGFSSVRAAFRKKFGKRWRYKSKAQDFILAASRPSALYDNLLIAANGWHNIHNDSLSGYSHGEKHIKMHAIAHLSGGGIKHKFAEDILFRKGLSAVLGHLWEPPEIMRLCADWRGMDDEECYTVWNGGQGALVVVDSKDVGSFIALARAHGVEARFCGNITSTKGPQKPSLTIYSKFREKIVQYYSK
jgi:phosphoribosylformylglycinamidine cyclo-ligase